MNRAYYAIIPATIRYDKRLTANAKLLYGEITALCNEKGYCWARNNYFAELYGVSKKSISKWIGQLTEYGYILSEIKYKENSREIETRYLKLIDSSANESSIPTEEKFHRGMEEKFHRGMEEKFQDNNTILNNTILNEGEYKKAPPLQKREEEIVSIYRETCKSYPEIIEITETRRKNMQFLLSKLDISKIRKAFEKAENTPFLKGKNKRNWIANFDFLIDYNNIVKLLEGFYDTYQQGFQHSRNPSYDIEEYERHSIFDDEDLNTF